MYAVGYADVPMTIIAAATTVVRFTETIMHIRMDFTAAVRIDGIILFRQIAKEIAAATGLYHHLMAVRSTLLSRHLAVSTETK